MQDEQEYEAPIDDSDDMLTRVNVMSNEERLREFVALSRRKKSLTAELDDVDTELAMLENALLSYFEENAISNMRIDNMTVYLRRQLWANAKDGDYARACAALKEIGLDDMVEERFNTSTLSAWVRERDKDGDVLPTVFTDAINVREQFNIRAVSRGPATTS